MTESDFDLDQITIAIEWENPRDVESHWIDGAIAALEAELVRERAYAPGSPTVLYLYDATVIDPESIRHAIARNALNLESIASLRLVPTEGLTYYQLKNHAAELATTPFIAFIDSDACPAPHWLRGLLRPFSDPRTKAVAGVTSVATRDLLSRTLALVWIFDLPSEHARARGQKRLHANNFAVRSDFFRENPFPNTAAFKKQCGIWVADIVERGFGFERTPEALALHAPHAGYKFLLWRAVQAGLDRDAKAELEGRSRLTRIAYAAQVFFKKNLRSTRRIVKHHREVALPFWQIPAALAVAWAYYSTLAGTQMVSAVLGGLPDSLRVRWVESA